ncbi:MAG: asparagine synthase (glutamine-hydrolyzing), partial [Candidatus Thermoplasmatota archaeon]
GASVDRVPVEAMTATMRSRGPDGAGVQRWPLAALGHRRLAILDPEGGAQPMVGPAGGSWLSYNGELFDHLELRKDLGQASAFRTRSDAETLLHAWERWGLDAFPRLHGQYAFAIYEEARHRLVLARDPLGIKPLYWARAGGTLLFASQPTAILASGLVTAELDPAAVTSHLSFRYPLGDHSWYRGIHALAPGTHLVASGGRVEISAHWAFPGPGRAPAGERAAGRLRAGFSDAVRRQLLSDVPVGAFLSGGLDSSTIVLAARDAGANLRTYAVGFSGGDVDELAAAREVSTMLGTAHREVLLGPEEYFDGMVRLIGLKRAPLLVPNEVAVFLLSEVARRDVTVLLSGEGADELLAGYGRIFRAAYDLDRLDGTREVSLEARRALASAFASRYGDAHRSLREHLLSLYEYVPLDVQKRLLQPEALDASLRDAWGTEADDARLPRFERVRRVFLRDHLPGLLLRLDSATMAASVEGRVPFLDVAFVEEVLTSFSENDLSPFVDPHAEEDAAPRLSADWSGIADVPKAPLRDAFPELPARVRRAAKVGFPVPLDTWFDGPLREQAGRILADRRTRGRGIFRPEALDALARGSLVPGRQGFVTWAVINLELACRVAFDAPDPPKT